jgi:4-amino-4-deoxy-L-arabinose transferase-like glycosyltransferase
VNNANTPDIVSGLVIFILLGVAAVMLISATRNHRLTVSFQIKLFFYAFAIRFAASFVLYVFGLSKITGDEDSLGWYYGVVMFQQWQKLAILDMPGVLAQAYQGTVPGYYYLTGLLFYVTKMPDRLAAAALNCFFGSLTVIFAYRAARMLFSEWVATRVGWLTCLFPSMIIWSAQTVKEPVVIFLETVALYGCVRLKVKGFSIRDILLCAAAMILVIPFRFYAAYIIAAAVALSLILPQIGKRRLSIGSAVILAIVVIPIVSMSGVLAQHEKQFEAFDLQFVQKFKENIATGPAQFGTNSGVKSDFDLNTSSGLGMAVVVGAAHLMLAPFPWQLGGGSLRMLLSLPELLAWWWLFFVGVVPGFWFLIRKRFSEIQPMLFFIFGLGFLYSLMFGNVGLVFRQRAQLLPWLLIFAAVGLEIRRFRQLDKRRAQEPSHLGRAAELDSPPASFPQPLVVEFPREKS